MMTVQGWAEIALTLSLSVALAWPIGIYLSRVWNGERTWLDPVLKPVEGLFYKAAGVDPKRSQGWVGYASALIAFNAVGFFLLYAILRLQNLLPLNPQGFAGMSPHLAFNTAVSFVTNTNWQSYGGESTASTLSQMVGFTTQNFLSAATGATIAAALARAFIANRGEGVGNFWADLTRTTLYLLLPLSIVLAAVLVGLGVVQVWRPRPLRPGWKAGRRRSPCSRPPARKPSSNWGSMAAAYSTPTPPIRSRTRRP
jgi:K+-transporting ATPase ATPase A chain